MLVVGIVVCLSVCLYVGCGHRRVSLCSAQVCVPLGHSSLYLLFVFFFSARNGTGRLNSSERDFLLVSVAESGAVFDKNGGREVANLYGMGRKSKSILETCMLRHAKTPKIMNGDSS